MNNTIKGLWKRLVNPETVSYLIFGVLTTVVNYVVNYLCYYRAGLSTFTSNNIAWVISVIFAFVVNKLFVFKSKSLKMDVIFKELYTFVIARLLSWGFETVFMVVSVDLCHMANWLAKLLSNVFVVIMNYFASKFLIFKNGDNKNE